MSKGAAQTIVMVMFGLLAAVALLKPEGSRYKQLWAAAAWSTGLAVFADLTPELVGPFAVLIIVAVAARNPGVIGGVLTGRAAASGSPPTATTGGAARAAGAAPPGPVGPVGAPAASR